MCIDGPAVGVTLNLRRAPYFLRVVQDTSGGWDALDQLEDEPTEEEAIFVYALARPAFHAHVCRRGRGQRSGWIAMGLYKHVPDAPVAELRDTVAWRTWAEAQPKPWDEDGD